MRSLVTFLLMLVGYVILAQNQEADKQIVDIEAFKKYSIQKFDLKEDLAAISDSTIKVTELVNYSRKSKTNFSGKVCENSKLKDFERNRTYYFNEKGKLFSIVDKLKYNDSTRKILTYYFGNGRSTKVIDDKKNDLTNTIDSGHLYFRIRKMFGPDINAIVD